MPSPSSRQPIWIAHLSWQPMMAVQWHFSPSRPSPVVSVASS
jgi:hypothetical protein